MLFFAITLLISGIKSASIKTANPKIGFAAISPTPKENLLREETSYWNDVGLQHLKERLNLEAQPKKHVAKNVVILIGDGMGISTITATRIYKGQRVYGKSGEDHKLVFDAFPNVALVKTYSVDFQVTDSAASATALFTGVKTRTSSLGVDVKVNLSDLDQDVYEKSQLEGIMTWAQGSGKDTGIITTTRITHATPAGTYAKTPHRDWECDSYVPESYRSFVKDIARQLVEDSPGNKFKVILGGGSQQLGHITQDSSSDKCVRSDRLNLTQLWIEKHNGTKAAFVKNNEELSKVTKDTDYLLGLFHPDHLPYELIRNKNLSGTPSLSEMAEKGLDILMKNPNGFVLMIEGGKIDLAHHKNYARLALEEGSEFDTTVELVLKRSGPDTLIIVTADHSHSLTFNGYPERGDDILGFGKETENDKPGLTLAYANGLGFTYHYKPNHTSILGPWLDARTDVNRLVDPYYQQIATFKVDDESHGGEDVAAYATGPGSHLIRGVIEQNYIAHFISYTACIGPRANLNLHCKKFC